MAPDGEEEVGAICFGAQLDFLRAGTLAAWGPSDCKLQQLETAFTKAKGRGSKAQHGAAMRWQTTHGSQDGEKDGVVALQ